MNKLDGLSLKFRARVEAALKYMAKDTELKAMGVKSIIVVEGVRSLSRQMAYYSRWLASYAAPEHKQEAVLRVQEYYEKAGPYPIGADEALIPCTWTLDSKHIDGLAVDLCPSRDGKEYWWKAPDEVWRRMCLIGNSFGLECGLNWPEKKKDPGHYEQKEA